MTVVVVVKADERVDDARVKGNAYAAIVSMTRQQSATVRVLRRLERMNDMILLSSVHYLLVRYAVRASTF